MNVVFALIFVFALQHISTYTNFISFYVLHQA